MVRETADAVIVGAGAAGLMCAMEAGRRGRRVVVLEHNPRIARKILISGGGRCNFTNRLTTAENFVSRNPHFAKSALARYTPSDFIALVERHGIPHHEKTLGQLFCDRAASDIGEMLEAECAAAGVRVMAGAAGGIVEMLEAECAAAGVRILTGCAVSRIGGMPAGTQGGGFEVETSRGVWHCAALAIATGGLSIPKIGATPFGYTVARQFGLHIVECYPALVPLTFGGVDRERFAGMAGVSADVTAKVSADVTTRASRCASGRGFREKLLFTHRGLSGPAILQASSYWRAGEYVEIDLLPGVDFAAALTVCRVAGTRTEVRTVLARYLPKRLADRWCRVQAISKAVIWLSDREVAEIEIGRASCRER